MRHVNICMQQKQAQDTENRLVVTEGEVVWEGRTGSWNQQIPTSVNRMDKQQGPTV